MVEKEPNQIDPEFRKLYPHLSDEELVEAQESFDRCLEVVWRIFLRIKEDPAEYARFKLLIEQQQVGFQGVSSSRQSGKLNPGEILLASQSLKYNYFFFVSP